MYIYINRTRPHNGTKKEGWKGAIRRNDEYKTNRQRGQQNWVEQKGTKIVQGGRLNKPHTHTTRAKKKTGKYIFIYIRKKNGRWRRHAASSTGKEKQKRCKFNDTKGWRQAFRRDPSKKKKNKRENLTNVHRFPPFTSFAPATIEIQYTSGSSKQRFVVLIVQSGDQKKKRIYSGERQFKMASS